MGHPASYYNHEPKPRSLSVITLALSPVFRYNIPKHNTVKGRCAAIKEIVWSRAQNGERADLLSRIAADISAGRQAYWLVPEPYSHETEFQLAKAGGTSACLYAEAVTFALLGERILTEAGGLARPILDGGGRLLTLRMALGTVSHRLVVFRKALGRAALLAQLLDTLDECKLYHISPADLEQAAFVAEGGTAERLQELSLILGAYEAACTAGAMDSRDRYQLVAAELSRCGFGADARLYVSGFVSFTPQERDILCLLANRAESVHIYLCGEPDREGFTAVQRTAEPLLRRISGLTQRLLRREDTSYAPALRHIERYWFDPAPPVYAQPHDALEILRAGSPAEECRFAAQRIAALCADGLRYRDIALLYPDDGVYAPLLATIFPHYRIPLFMDKMDEVSRKPLFNCVRTILDCALFGFRPADTVALLRCGLSPYPDTLIDAFEDYLTLWRFRGKRFSHQDFAKSPKGYRAALSPGDERSLRRLNHLRRYVADGVAPVENRKKTAADHTKALFSALERLHIFQGLTLRRHMLERQGVPKLALENEQLWDFLIAALEQCAGVLGDEILSLGEFGDLLLLTLSGYSVGTIPAALDRLHAGAIGRFARTPRPVVILLGATEEALPIRSGASGFLRTGERDALAKMNVELPPDERQRLEREHFHLYTALTLAKERLILVFPSEKGQDLEGAAGCVKRCAELLDRKALPVPPLYYPAPGEPPDAPKDDPLSPAAASALYGDTLMLSPSRLIKYQQCPFAFFAAFGLRLRPRPQGSFTAADAGAVLHEILEQAARHIVETTGFAAITGEEACAVALSIAEEVVRRTLHSGQAASARIAAQGSRLLGTVEKLASCLWEEMHHSDFVPTAFELRCESAEMPTAAPPGAPSAYKIYGVADRVDLCRREDALYLRVADYKSGRERFAYANVYNGIGAQLLQYLFLLCDEAHRYFPQYDQPARPAGILYLPSQSAAVLSDAPLSAETAKTIERDAQRRDGLILADEAVIAAMDRDYRQPGHDTLLPIALNKDQSLSRLSKVVTTEEMTLLRRFVQDLGQNTAAAIAAGDVRPRPLYATPGDNACTYCDYAAACQFTEERCGLRHKQGIKAEEFYALLRPSGEEAVKP